MKVFGKGRLKQAWRNLMHSTHHNISRGAENISRMISFARNNNWRRRHADRAKLHEDRHKRS